MDFSYPLLCSCERNGQRPAIVGRGRSLTYAELERDIAGLAGGLRQLVSPRERVGSLMLNEPDTVILYMALARIGAVSVPVNTRLSLEEKRFIARDAQISVLVVDDAFLGEAQRIQSAVSDVRMILVAGGDDPTSLQGLRRGPPEAPPCADDGDEDATATILYTSGTTGFAKGVMRSHRANIWNAVNSALGSPRTATDVELFNLPIFGIGFLHFAMPALLGGATLVLDRAFEPERVWALLHEQMATRTFLAPTMIAAMLEIEGHQSVDLGALQVVYTAYAFPERLRRRALERFGDRFVHMYGLTEAQLTCARVGELSEKPDSVGRTMGLMRVRILDELGSPVGVGSAGEIAFEGPAVMSGYLGRADETVAALPDGWLRTGDLGLIDEDGDLRYLGRQKDMIKTGGFSVDPVEVENAILTVDAVGEASVLGVEDEHWGEMVVAFLAPRPGALIDLDAVRAACRERIAAYKVPKRLFVVDELPKNATGKVERATLGAWYRASGSGTPATERTGGTDGGGTDGGGTGSCRMDGNP